MANYLIEKYIVLLLCPQYSTYNLSVLECCLQFAHSKLVQFNLTLIAGQELVIDMDARTAVINPGGNNAMPDRSPDSESWPLIPGDNSITCLTSADGSDFDFSWYTRYVGV